MKRPSLLPALLLAAGILAGTFLSKLTAGSGDLVLVGPVALALSVVAAAIARARETCSRAVLVDGGYLVGAIVVAGAILAWKDPSSVASMLPVIGAASSVPLLLARRGACGARAGG